MKRKQLLRRMEAGFSLIELLIAITIIGIMAAVAIPNLLSYLRKGRETAAISSLKTVHQAQTQYQSNRGRFGALKELAAEGILDKQYASGQPINGYIYTDSDVTPDTYTVHADRQNDGTATRDFNITEEGVVFYKESKTKGTVARGEGSAYSSTEVKAADQAPAAQPKP